jgi:hypothetical protein
MKSKEIIEALEDIERHLSAETPAVTSVRIRKLIDKIKEKPNREIEIVTS